MKITISGPPGSGKTTVGKALAKKLKLKFYSSGDFFRKIAYQKGMNLNEFSKYCEQHPEIDDLIDKRQMQFGKEHDDFVLESRLGFFFIPDSIKIYLDADEKTRIRRIMKARRKDEKSKNEKEALAKINQREKSEIKRWQKVYKVNYQEKKHYDKVINTSSLDIQDVVNKIIDYINKK